MEIWQLVALGIAGNLVMGFVIDLCTTVGHLGGVSSGSKTFFYEVMKDARWYPGTHAFTIVAGSTGFLFFLLYFLIGGIKVFLSGRKRERAT